MPLNSLKKNISRESPWPPTTPLWLISPGSSLRNVCSWSTEPEVVGTSVHGLRTLWTQKILWRRSCHTKELLFSGLDET